MKKHKEIKIFYILTIVIFLSILIFTGCDRGPQKITEPLDIMSLKHNEGVKNEGELLIDYDITYPQIKDTLNHPCLLKINEFYKNKFDDMTRKNIAESKKMASEDFLAAIEGGYEFLPHILGNSFEVTYNNKGLLSINLIENTYWGGAHPNAYKESAVFDVNTGQKLTLGRLFALEETEAINIVLEKVKDEIEEFGTEELFLFPDALETLPEAYFAEDFYYDGENIVLYFQQYAIAPYASGFPEFRISIKDVPYFNK